MPYANPKDMTDSELLTFANKKLHCLENDGGVMGWGTKHSEDIYFLRNIGLANPLGSHRLHRAGECQRHGNTLSTFHLLKVFKILRDSKHANGLWAMAQMFFFGLTNGY